VARASPPQKKKLKNNTFSGNYYVKFGHFSGKNRVKLGNVVNFSENVIKIRVFFSNFLARIM